MIGSFSNLSFVRPSALYKTKYMTTGLDWCWQIALRFLVLFSFFFLYISSCSLTCQVNANSIQSNQSKSKLFFLLSIYDKWVIMIKMNTSIFKFITNSKVKMAFNWFNKKNHLTKNAQFFNVFDKWDMKHRTLHKVTICYMSL